MAQTSYRKLVTMVSELDHENFILLRMLAEARGLDGESPLSAYEAMMDEVDARKAQSASA